MKINMNDSVRVTLTATGAQVYNKYLSQFTFSGRREPNTTEGYVLKTPLWDLMHIFGNSIYMGCNVPFEFNVLELV